MIQVNSDVLVFREFIASVSLKNAQEYDRLNNKKQAKSFKPTADTEERAVKIKVKRGQVI